MNVRTGWVVRKSRVLLQVLFLVLFLFLFVYPYYIVVESWRFGSVFFYIDPLIFVSKIIVTGKIFPLFLFSLTPLVLTVFFGRFFCGWVCPLGTINQFFSWLFRKSKHREKVLRKEILKVKYYILILLLGLALVGANVIGWVDPFSLLTRSVAIITPASDYLVQQVANPKVSNKTNQEVFSLPVESGKTKPAGLVKSHIQGVFIGGIFLLIIGLNYYHRRFFCNIICPLGAMYGLVAKYGFFNIRTTPSCNSCNTCSKNCTYNGNAGELFLRSECVSCLNCVVDCPSNSVEIKIELPKKKKNTTVELGRRRMITALGTGIVLASFSKINPAIKKKGRHSFIRPPGAIGEEEFLKNCSSCGQCTQSCPTGFIQPAFLDAGLEGLLTPIGSAKAGYCRFDCNTCTQVCPTDALKKLSLKEKQEFKIGLAIVDKNRCYTYADGINCTICYDKCPVAEKAIMLKEAEVWNYKGRLSTVKQVHILSDLCIGCGICEYVCPRKDSPGIIVVSENESREMESDLF